MAVVQTLIGNIKGPQGAQGETGATGAAGAAATVDVGSVTTTAYGNAAQVTNSGTTSAAVLDFVIPQGKPGEATTTMGNLTLDSITTSTASFPSPQVGDTGKTAFGKIVKFFADTVAALNSKLNTADVVNNLTTTAGGYALDARQGKALNDSLSSATTPLKYTAVAGTSVTINGQNVYKIGRIVLLSFDVTTSGSLATNSNIITDVPGAIATTEFFASNSSTGETHTFYVTSAGLVRTSGSLSAGTWIVNASYVSYSN